MRFVPVCCPRCGLSFSVVVSGQYRSARLDREAWCGTCLRAAEVAEPRLCSEFRVVVMGVLGEGEKPKLVGETPEQPRNHHRKPGPGRGHKGKQTA